MRAMTPVGALCAAVSLAPAAHADARLAGLPEPKIVHHEPGRTAASLDAVLLPARRYHAFWDSEDERYARQALSPTFVDLNLPAGRPQGPEGPLLASRAFRAAVPDLRATAEEVWVVGNRVIGRLRFTGRFTGAFGDLRGQGQPIEFQAIDIYTVEGGVITTNWHLEDNQTLLEQLRALPPRNPSD